MSSFHPSESCAVSFTLPLWVFVWPCIWSHFCWQPVKGRRCPCWLDRSMFEQCVLGILQPLAWGSCLSDWTHIFIFRTLPSLCLLVPRLCPSSANSWYLLCNHFGTGNFITVFLKMFFHVSVRHYWNVLVAYYIHSENMYENSFSYILSFLLCQ